MRKLLLLICLLYALSNFGVQAQQNTPISLGTIDTIHSKILGEERTVWVYVPNANKDSRFAKVKYPVIYLLDGNIAFSAVTGMMQYLSSVQVGICPEVIVVGITHKNRTRDLTPPLAKANAADSNASGGGEKFLGFMEKELMPYIESTYPTLPYKAFIGHSLGGLMVMQALIHHNGLFNAYAALDPSMWWDNQKLLKETSELLKKADPVDKPVYLAIANTMPKGQDTVSVKKDSMPGTLHIRSILELNRLLKANKTNFTSRYYENYVHDPVSLAGTYDAILWFFKTYKPSLRQMDYSPAYVDTLKNKVETHYAKFSTVLGVTYAPPEKWMHVQGTSSMGRKQMEAASYFFKTNIVNYPTSFNANDAMGDFYVVNNNTEKAIEFFKKALSIKEIEETRRKLKKLELK